MPISRGVKKVSENIMADGRSVIITTNDKDSYDWDHVPAGTIKVDPLTGAAYTKMENGADWVPLAVSRLTEDVQTLVNSIAGFSGRMNQLEMNQSDIMMKLKMKDMLPGSNLMLVEDFSNPTTIDQSRIKVTSTVASSDSIDVETLDGVIIGAHYTLTDGVNQEEIQIKNAVRNGSTYRIIAMDTVKATFNIKKTYLYRTTAKINMALGLAYGAGDRQVISETPSTNWQGVSANVASVADLDTSISNQKSFTITGDCVFNDHAMMTLA